MNAKTFVLSVARQYGPDRLFVFHGPTHCLIGRASDCDIRVPSDASCADVSYHHCSFMIDSLKVLVRDLGSLNGTYVNGRRIGQPNGRQVSDDADSHRYTEVELTDGDVVRVGPMVIRVNVEDFPRPEPLGVMAMVRCGDI